jgi:dTDP-glucose 4,6-dehydratase
MKWLVTGACGFIGSNFVRGLCIKYEDVVCVDKLTYAGDVMNIAELGTDIIQADISDAPVMKNLIKTHKPDIVVNFAAESHVDRSIDSAEDFIKTNIVGVSVLLDLALEYGFKFIQVSTDEVYGSVEQQDGKRFLEDMKLYPNSPYSASKASADLLVLSYVHTHKINAMITRCSNNYGAYQHPEKMVPKCIINCFTNKDIPLYGDGMNVRDWIHVDDHCKGIYKVATKDLPSGSIYNFGGLTQITNRILVDRIIDHAKGSPKQIKMVEDRKGHDRTYGVDITKAWDDLQWSPTISFEEGLKDTIKWYKDHEDWWKGKI